MIKDVDKFNNLFSLVVFDILNDEFPNRKKPKVVIKFSNRLSKYNARISYNRSFSNYSFSLNSSWVDSDINIVRGLFEYLIFKINKLNKKTIYTQLYDTFVKNIHTSIIKENIDPFLNELFIENNSELLNNEIEQTNIIWGSRTKTILGTYNYNSDTIKISSILKKAPREFIRFIVYHEMLHKKHKYLVKDKKMIHHSKEFKQEEKKFPNYEYINKNLKYYL